jgi:hypothetical protein
MIDVSNLVLYSGANSFKNTGVYTINLTLDGSLGAGAQTSDSVSITLTESQQFVFAQAKYAEYAKGVFGGDTTTRWQPIPCFDVYLSTNLGPLRAYIIPQINGSTVTFTAGAQNDAYPGTATFSTTYQIKYVTYTVDS